PDHGGHRPAEHHHHRWVRVRDRCLGGPGASADHDQQRGAPLAARGLPVRPASPGAHRGAGAARARPRHAGLQLTTGRGMAETDASPAAEAVGEEAPVAADAASVPENGEAPSARAGPAAPSGPIAPTLTILETRVLRGPNLWVRAPV